MSRLTLVELRRLLRRRLAWFAVVLTAGILGLALYGVHDFVRFASAELGNAETYYAEALRDWEENGEEYVESCFAEQEREREMAGDDSIDYGCDQMTAPRLEDFQWGPQSLFEQVAELLSQLVFPMLCVMLLVGATATAAEFAARTMGTWLTFEPRRDRVFASKVLAPGLWGVPVALGYLAAVVLGVSAIFRLHGVDDHITGAEWGDIGWICLRSAALLVLTAMVGAASGMAMRHTAAVLGTLVGYLVAVELLAAQFFSGISRYLLSNNILGWVKGGHSWETWDCSMVSGECSSTLHEISTGDSALVLGSVLAIVFLLSWLLFRRADVD